MSAPFGPVAGITTGHSGREAAAFQPDEPEARTTKNTQEYLCEGSAVGKVSEKQWVINKTGRNQVLR